MTKGSAGWYLKWLDNHFERLRAITERKNADYSTGGDLTRNAFANFEYLEKATHGLWGTEIGFLFRMSDKWTRMLTLIANNGERSVKEETVEDTIDDLTIYLCIFRAWREATRTHKEKVPHVKGNKWRASD